MKAATLKIIGVNILVFLGLLLLVELTGQMIAVLRPSYNVLFLQPDKEVGWKQVPNFRYTWAGNYWYAADFSVDVETNSHGFRDLPREFSKPQGVMRVAVMGDSLIEAVQVPLARTATQVLEQRLNTDQNQNHSQKWEALNFGISNYGVGQYLLAWEQYASKYHPDYVVIFVAALHMKRTIDKYESSVGDSAHKPLWVRPTFRLDNTSLVREPAGDFDEFVIAQQDLINKEFAGKRTRKKTRFLLPVYARHIGKALANFSALFHQPSMVHHSRSVSIVPKADQLMLAVNLKIIEELGREVNAAGGKLVVVDASQYFGDQEFVSLALNELCTQHHFGYVPVYRNLLQANASGISTKWAHDGHFNEEGNRILADSLYDWIAQESVTHP